MVIKLLNWFSHLAEEVDLTGRIAEVGQVGDGEAELLRDVVGDEDLLGQLNPRAMLRPVGDQLAGVVLQEGEDGGGVAADDRLLAGAGLTGQVGAPVGVDAPGAGPG